MRQLFFSYFGLRRCIRQWRRNKFLRPMRTYEQALKFSLFTNGLFFMACWSFLGWKLISVLVSVDEVTGNETVTSVKEHVKKKRIDTTNLNLTEYITGKELVPRRPPVEMTKTEFPADDFA